MRVLILGGTGFIGAHLARRISLTGAETFVADTHTPNRLDGRANLLRNAKFFHHDVQDRFDLQSIFGQSSHNIIYYLAAVSTVKLVDNNPVDAGNSMIRGLVNSLELLREMSDRVRFIFVSSSMVYGNFESEPIPEDGATNPISLYGGLKLAGETLTKAYLNKIGGEYVIVRPSGVYGPTDANGRIVQRVCESAVRRESITVVNPSDSFIDFTWVEDLVEGLVQTALCPEAANQTFNLSFGLGRSLDDLLEVISRLEPRISVVRKFISEPQGPRRGALDISKARRLIGYSPRIDLDHGLERYLEYIRSST